MKHVVHTVARTPNTRVDRCSCGAVHITVGGTTIRLKEPAARELLDSLKRGLAASAEPTTFAPMPVIHLVSPKDDEPDEGPQVH